jgi:hypothetical protein
MIKKSNRFSQEARQRAARMVQGLQEIAAEDPRNLADLKSLVQRWLNIADAL